MVRTRNSWADGHTVRATAVSSIRPIAMEANMEQVETKLARIAKNCNSRGLDKISGNAIKMDSNTRSRG
jgi:hypothetical protein